MFEDIGADLGDDPFADPHHKEIAHPAGGREGGHDAEQHEEIGVDQRRIVAGEPEVDHAPDRGGQDEGDGGGGDKGDQGRGSHPAMPFEVGKEAG